jgi:DNA-binding protein HU-beta
MNKQDLIKAIATKLEVNKKDVETIVDAVFDTIGETLVSGEDVNLSGFGKLVVKDTAPRVARNPKTGESVDVPASRKVAFKAAKVLKDAVAK